MHPFCFSGDTTVSVVAIEGASCLAGAQCFNSDCRTGLGNHCDRALIQARGRDAILRVAPRLQSLTCRLHGDLPSLCFSCCAVKIVAYHLPPASQQPDFSLPVLAVLFKLWLAASPLLLFLPPEHSSLRPRGGQGSRLCSAPRRPVPSGPEVAAFAPKRYRYYLVARSPRVYQDTRHSSPIWRECKSP